MRNATLQWETRLEAVAKQNRTYSFSTLMFSWSVDWWLLWRFAEAWCVRATKWMINLLQALSYDMSHYLVYSTANTQVFYAKISRLSRRCLLTECVLFTSVVSISLSYNAVRKFGTFFAPPGSSMNGDTAKQIAQTAQLHYFSNCVINVWHIPVDRAARP